MKKPLHACRRGSGSGFTLVELLVVVLIITLVMTAGIVGVRNVTAGKGTAAAVASIESLFAEARTAAIGQGTKARVLVDVNDPNEPDYLRRVVVAYLDEDGQWTLTGRAYQMPSGVYFSRDLSRSSGTDNTASLYSEAGEPMNSYNGEWEYYEFNGQGLFQPDGNVGSDDAPGAFVIGAGQRSPGAAAPRVTSVAARDFSGFVIWRNGGTAAYQSPEQMDGAPEEPGATF